MERHFKKILMLSFIMLVVISVLASCGIGNQNNNSGSCKISFNNLKGATVPEINQYDSAVGISPDDMPVPEVIGWKFIGWYTASSGGELIDYIPAGSTADYALFAHWEAETFSITYVDAPSHSNATEYTTEKEVKLSAPVWSGLTFSHWTDENGNVVDKIDKGSLGDRVLTAHWNLLEGYTTPFEGEREPMVIYDEEEARHYFIFQIGTINNIPLGNLCDPEYKYQGGDISWTVSETVGFDESIAESVSKTVAKTVSQSTELSNILNSEIGESITKSSSVSAELSAEYMGITAKIAGSLGAENTTSNSFSTTKTNINRNDVTDENSKTTSSTVSYNNNYSTTIQVTKSVSAEMPEGTYSLVYAGKVYVYAIITFDHDYKEYYIDIFSYMVDEIAQMPIYTPPPQCTADITPKDDITCILTENDITNMKNYVTNSFYINYDANGGEGEMPMSVVQIGHGQKLYSNAYTKTGYTFNGWLLQSENETTILADGETISDLASVGETVTLTAVWTANIYNVNYDANGGEGTVNSTIETYDKEFTVAENKLTRVGHTFIGWNTSPDGNGTFFYEGDKAINLRSDLNDNITLYAIWQTNRYTITFVTDGGTVTETQTYYYGSITYAPGNPALENHSFEGWEFDCKFEFGDAMPANDIVATAKWVKTKSTVQLGSGNNARHKIIQWSSLGNDEHSHGEDHVSPDLNRDQLLSYGYTKLSVSVSFKYKVVDWGDQVIIIYSGAGHEVTRFSYEWDERDWTHGTITFELSINEQITSSGDFSIRWDLTKDGYQSDTWYVGGTTISITAVK